MKVQFCNKLLGGKSQIIHSLGSVVNCQEVYDRYSAVQYSAVQDSTVQEVYDRFGKERRFRAKKKRRRLPQHGRPVPQVGDDKDVDD